MKQILTIKLRNILLAWAVTTIVLVLLKYIISFFLPEFYDIQKIETIPFSMTKFFSFCVLAPIWEEALFRYAPIEFVRRTTTAEKFKELQMPLVILISIVFGWMHGSVQNIWIQGVSGLGLGWVYIKNDFSYKSSVILHSLWNFMIAFGFSYL